MKVSHKDMTDLDKVFAGNDIITAIRHLSEKFPGKVAFASSFGAEDQVLTDIICKAKIKIRFLTLDTGRLFPETYDLIERTVAKYKIRFEIYFPEAEAVEKMVSRKGINLFYDSVENRRLCCKIRKVIPMKRAIAGSEVLITGLRKEHVETRSGMAMVAKDKQYGVIKISPLLNWTWEQVVRYLDEKNVPNNPLHHKGYLSIGCQPCTRAIEEGEDIRAGRWWWENGKKECGLHG